MNSPQRIRQALNHREPDRVPFDLGGTGLTTIHVTAYRKLRQHLGLMPTLPRVAYLAEQLAAVDEDLAERLETDSRPVQPDLPATRSGKIPRRTPRPRRAGRRTRDHHALHLARRVHAA